MDNLNYLVNMYGMRDPYKSELEFFKKRPEVAGMATEDNKIVLNPLSQLSKDELNAVSRNEALRLFMRQNAISPSFNLTKSQMEMFRGSEYEKDANAAKQTILARILTGDPSAKDATLDQTLEAQNIMARINKMAQGNTPAGAMTANPRVMAQGQESRFLREIKKTPWFAEFVREYGEEPDLSRNADYDYRRAWAAGIRPERDPYDNNRYHWASSLPTGELLKSENHPTLWKEQYMRATGRNPDETGVTEAQWQAMQKGQRR
jgi:hypothetical protein